MGRKPYKLKAFRKHLIKLYRKGINNNVIILILFKEYRLKVLRSTFYRYLRV